MAKKKKKTTKRTSSKKKNKTLIFDIDGVLIDVNKSYIMAIKKTAEFFLGRLIDIKEVYELKSVQGFNNDYDCAEAIIKRKGFNVRRDALIKKFQEYYKGRKYDGLIINEKSLINEKVLQDLGKRYNLAIFTGRPKDEALFALQANKMMDYFSFMVTMDDVKEQKPNPEGLKKIASRFKTNKIIYVGDSVDDAQAASSIEMPFIAVLNELSDKKRQKMLFKQYGISNTIEDINKIKEALK